MAGSSFIGTFVEVQLSSGAGIFGYIAAVDPVSQTLSFRDPHTGKVSTLGKSEIANIQIRDPPPAADDAVLSKSEAQQLQAQMDAAEAKLAALEPPSAAQAPISRNGTPDPGKKPKTRSKGAKKAAQQASAGPSYTEEFDFEGNLNQFDKKRIWDEIRSSDKTDPSHLLVSHNRASTPVQLVRGPNGIGPVPVYPDHAEGSPRISHRAGGGRDGQEKLGIYEPVLSPSPPPSEARRGATGAAQGGGSGSGAALSPASAPAKADAANASDSGVVRELRMRLALLQSLSGITLRPVEHEATGSDDKRWQRQYEATMWKDHKAQAEALESGGHDGSFTVAFSATHQLSGKTLPSENSTAAEVQLSDLRYLSPVAGKSDASIIERLPAKYQQEMSLRNETANIFVRRLRGAAFGEGQ